MPGPVSEVETHGEGEAILRLREEVLSAGLSPSHDIASGSGRWQWAEGEHQTFIGQDAFLTSALAKQHGSGLGRNDQEADALIFTLISTRHLNKGNALHLKVIAQDVILLLVDAILELRVEVFARCCDHRPAGTRRKSSFKFRGRLR
jgi:hypothetical protein